ncbi:hypothetical protein PHMEG_0006783 [Phytophthora megakarya]|uniref:Uncharacterized protein n=1 Tax=Phytophthora megakarya TaxID=4795 RepID=A0A225WN19_9STRA|nr:hypothetical protein PHMEG_0006783 [Phytophthora megakarya]
MWVAGDANVTADLTSRRPDWCDGTSRAISLSELATQLISQDGNLDEDSVFAQSISLRSYILDLCQRNYATDPIFGPILRDLTNENDTGSRRLRPFTLVDGVFTYGIWAFVDRLTKRGHFVATRTDASAADTAIISILSYHATKFTSVLQKNSTQLQDTRLNFSTAFCPSTDRQSEVTIKFVNEYIRHFVATHHDG